MCVSHFSTNLSLCISLFTTACLSLYPRGHVSLSPWGPYRWFCVACICLCLCVYPPSCVFLCPCGSLSLHLSSGSVYLHPLPVRESPLPLPVLSPVRARGRVRGSEMLSADSGSRACGRGATGGGQGRRPLPGPSPWAAQPPPAAPAGARPGRPLPRAVCGELAPPPPGAAPPPRPGPLARSLARRRSGGDGWNVEEFGWARLRSARLGYGRRESAELG